MKALTTMRFLSSAFASSCASSFVLGLLGACSTAPTENAASTEAAVSGVAIGDVRGVVDITKTLRTRLFDEQDVRTASFDVSRVAGPVFRLRKQLGVFAQEGTTSTYLGGTPTPLRATLWHQVMGRFATAVGDMCLADPAATSTNSVTFVAYAQGAGGMIVTPTQFFLRPQVADLVHRACVFDGTEEGRRDVAGQLWDTFMGIGGTLAADKASFVEATATDPSSLKAAPKDRVANMVVSMLLNPHFLLAK